jgi:uncharacterized protein (TIGR02246 family)
MADSSQHPDAHDVLGVYQALLDAWNRQDAAGMASVLTSGALIVGFDGSQMVGPEEVETTISGIFAHHKTASYVSIVRSLRFVGPDVALIHAVAGMTPPGKTEINPAVNAIQTVVASRRDGRWLIQQYQNTPAAFHGRPEASEALTRELQDAVNARG